MLEKTRTFNQILTITISWCKEHLKDGGQIDQKTLFESVKGEWENRLLLWEEINPFVKETLNIRDFYPDEIAVRESVGGLCKKLAHKANQSLNAVNGKGARNNDIVPIPPGKIIDRPTVFILSSARSGSTLLRTMLAGHTELNAPPELHLLGYSDLKSREREIVDEGTIWKLSGLMQTLARQMQITEGQAFTLLSKFTDRDFPISRIYELIHSSSSKPTLVDKTPSIIQSSARLNQAEQMFKSPKYIHLIRHPGAVIESLERMKHIMLTQHMLTKHKDAFSRLKKVESDWRVHNRNAQEFLSNIPGERHLRVLYEDLVRRPGSIMQALAEFIGVDFEESMLDPYSGDRLISGIGDPNITSRNKVDPQLIDSWKANLGDYTFDDETIELAEQFGIAI
jgi:hypothetical protein